MSLLLLVSLMMTARFLRPTWQAHLERSIPVTILHVHFFYKTWKSTVLSAAMLNMQCSRKNFAGKLTLNSGRMLLLLFQGTRMRLVSLYLQVFFYVY